MAKHYEAIQRAEQERLRRTGGEPEAVAAIDWDTTPSTAPRAQPSVLKRLFARRSRDHRAPETSNAINKRRISILQPESIAAEQFRTLRGRIDSMATQRPMRTVALTSANPDEGKSTAAINLAVVTSMSVGRRVLLVDCDLRKPKIHKSLGIDPTSGLAEVLMGQASFDDAIVKVEGLALEVLPVRTPPANPSELLASLEMRQLVEQLASRYDQVILDTPACLGLPDAKTVTELADGIIVVVRADVTPREDVQTVLEILDGDRVLGVVLNGIEPNRQQYGYY